MAAKLSPWNRLFRESKPLVHTLRLEGMITSGRGAGFGAGAFTLVHFSPQVSAFCWPHASTSRLAVSILRGICWEVSEAKTSRADELRSEGLLWTKSCLC